MIRKTFLALAVLTLALVASGCGFSDLGVSNITMSASTTPTGYSCTQWSPGGGCYYFINKGKAVACQGDTSNVAICTNANGDFYNYYASATYLCVNQRCVNQVACSPKYAYDNLMNKGQAWQVVNQQADQNTTQGPITISFTSTSSTTVSASASIDLSANADALLGIIFVSVHAQINASVSKTASTAVGNEVRVTIPAGMTANGIYGVRVQVTSGKLYQGSSCGAGGGEINYGKVQTYVPIGSGWCVWLSGHTPCPVVPGS
jgi:hypothetical protein